MNIQEADILNSLALKPYINQRILAETTGHSLGIVNRSIKNLIREGFLDEEINTTHKAKKALEHKAPENAVILAAGFGMRMVPINMTTPKGLIEIEGEPLVERIIKQLHDANIYEIHIVVGFMKEQFEYLIDEYGVNLIVNEGYAGKNNLHSLNLARGYLTNSYIIPCDIWCEKNPFNRYEPYSWYMVTDSFDSGSSVRVNRKMELVTTSNSSDGNAMVGIAYLLEADSHILSERMKILDADIRYENSFWEEALYEKNKMIVAPKVVSTKDVIEINTFEQLRELDSRSSQLQSDAIAVIAKTFNTSVDNITDIEVLKKGMTNRSFRFSCDGKKYIMRIPGEGTDQLINRAEETSVYQTIKDKGICDDISYINAINGYKITEYLVDARVCNPNSAHDIAKCMIKLREFHNQRFVVEHEFDIFRQIELYESFWNGQPSTYKDYAKTKEQVFSLQTYINSHVDEKILTHIDAVPDNFLFVKGTDGKETVRLIDWEYAGMQDPHVDIAMFCIYAMYSREQVDQLIQLYFNGICPTSIRIKIYCYISACGLLWSNWCEYKRNLGVEFGEYSLRQYRFAKEYYKIVQNELGGLNKDDE